ncbi:MAG: hypothetical protein ACRDL0_10900, partial [Thermoleophilaceae bacterium]
MRRFERLSEGELDRLLAGRAPDERPELDDIALFARGLRARLAVAPDRDLEARHMAALVRESAEQRLRGGTETGAPARRAPRPALRMALAGLSVFLTTAGLAMAGVPLRPAERLLETLGVSEESGGSEAGERGRVGSPAREPEPRPSGAR